MSLGTNYARNYGKDTQQAALNLILKQSRVAYMVKKTKHTIDLWLTPSAGGITLPFTQSVAFLVNVARGQWESRHPFDGRLLAKGVSQRDVIRATIQTIWQ